jgi:biopolymer transport protein ExbD
MKFASSVRPGLIVLTIAIAIYAIPIRWIETRRFTPLDTPVSISNGHFRTGEFKINLDSQYFVAFYRPDFANPEYSNCASEALTNSKWTVFKNGKAIVISAPAAPGEQPWNRIDYFATGPGTYSIEVEVLPGAECLNVARMQLVVWTYNDYEDLLDFLRGTLVFLCGVGIVLLIRSSAASFQTQPEDRHRVQLQISLSPGYSRTFGFRKRRPMPRFHRIPNFGLFFFIAMLAPLIAFMILRVSVTVSMGIKTHLTRPTGFSVNIDPHSKPLLVWIDADSNFFLNEKKIARNDLRAALKRELSKRAELTVYFEADGNIFFGDAAFAMNEIKNASGKLVWLTPKTRQDFAAQIPTK